MSKESIKEFLHVAADKVAKFIAMVINKAKELFEKLKKSDRRFIILVSVAAVLVIILFALIINGIVKSDKKDPIEAEGTSNNILDMPTTDAPEIETVVTTSGTYTVNTDSLNFRQRPDVSSALLGTFTSGTTLEVYDIIEGGKYTWGLVVDSNGMAGWVCMDYLTKK